MFVVVVVVEAEALEVRLPPPVASPLTGVDGGGNTFGVALGVDGPPVENIDGNCCWCCGRDSGGGGGGC